jgi:adenylate cyclase
MQQPPTQRRLAAILAADVVGFSRMMGADEEGTLTRLKRIRETLTDPAIAEWRGRIFKTTGDGFLAEFPSVVDAVQCAAKIQVAMAARAAAAPPAERLVFRIGINLGDVIVEGDDLYGDGVNVAARLEGICDPGGVAISGNAYEQVRGKAGQAFVSRGEHRVKNIARPVPVWAVDLRAHGIGFRRNYSRLRRWAAAAAALAVLAAGGLFYAKMQRPAEGSATIAVLPFANQSGDAKRDYFSDGVTEDIINALGRFSGVRVSARNAVQPYKGRPATPEEVSRELGVRYLVQGSVRQADGRIRVAVELSDAMKRTVLWSERYEGEGREVFDIQDRIVRQVVGALAVKVTSLEQQRAAAKPPEALEAYDLVLRARESLSRLDRVANREARMLAAQALKVAPNYAEAHVILAEADLQRSALGFVENAEEALARGEETARRALAIDDPGANARAHAVLGAILALSRRYDEGLKAAEQALALNPSDAHAHGLRGDVLLWIGRVEDSIAALETARRFDPRLRAEFMFDLVLAYYLAGRYNDALAVAQSGLSLTPGSVFLHVAHAITLAQLGDAAGAARAVEEARRLSPVFDAAAFGRLLVEAKHRQAVQEGVRKAGFPAGR